MKEYGMCQAIEELMNPHAAFFRSMADNSGMTHSVSAQNDTTEQNKVKWLNNLCKEQQSQLTVEEVAWRHSVKVGDYIDAVCRYNTTSSTQNT
jgi:hypothetical protein